MSEQDVIAPVIEYEQQRLSDGPFMGRYITIDSELQSTFVFSCFTNGKFYLGRYKRQWPDQFVWH